MTDKPHTVVIEEVTDPQELAEARARRTRFDRNETWLQAHAAEIYRCHRGRYICIAGNELFVADTPDGAYASGKSAHPEDDGSFVRYIPKEKLPRVYAD
jgi:hypothetical protein